MKKWIAPSVLDMEVAETQYGGKKTEEFDYIYVNEQGNWEGTFKES